MAEGTALQTMTGAVVAISASLPATYNAAGYAATAMVYTAVGEVENHGSHGVKRNISTFVAVSDGVLKKLPGVKNYGTKSMVLGNLPSDGGQDIIEAAVESQNRYSVKITYPLRTNEATNEVHYLDVIVASREWQDGAADDVRKINVDLEICRAPVVVAAT